MREVVVYGEIDAQNDANDHEKAEKSVHKSATIKTVQTHWDEGDPCEGPCVDHGHGS